MRLAILYFGGTGNKDDVARYLARSLAAPELDIALWSIERVGPEILPWFDVLVLGFPVYEVDSPRFMHSYLACLAAGKGRGAYVCCTKGAIAGNAVGRNLRRLRDRGYVPLGGASIGMPGSDGLRFARKESWMAHTALQKDFDRLRSVDRLAVQMRVELSGIARGTPADAYRRPLPLSATGVLFDWMWSALYDAFAGHLRRALRAAPSCTSCGLCARLCPVGALQLLDDRPRFSERCELCMRCLHACPAEAIQLGRWTVGKPRWHGPKGEFRPLALRPLADRVGGAA